MLLTTDQRATGLNVQQVSAVINIFHIFGGTGAAICTEP